VFERESLRVLTARGGTEALELLRKEPVSVVLTDLVMPGMSGLDLLKASRSVSPETETILMTAYGTVENAVEAMRQGAYDFVTKPLKRAHVVRAVTKALEKRNLVQENRSLRAQLAAQRQKTPIGQSLPWRHTMNTVMQAAPSMATVLLLGESGTGKELLARAIHEASPAGRGPFVPVNCAALPESILEAELFGYERGAFTGRHPAPRRPLPAGRSGHAVPGRDRGDPHPRAGEAVAGAAGGRGRAPGRAHHQGRHAPRGRTNQDLRAAVKEGRFREDLYYRLHVIALRIPPLRERRDDILSWPSTSCASTASGNGRHLAGLSAPPAEALLALRLAGNVRELENTIERAVVLSRGAGSSCRGSSPGRGPLGDRRLHDGKSLTFAVCTPLDGDRAPGIHADAEATLAATSACARSYWASRRGRSTGGWRRERAGVRRSPMRVPSPTRGRSRKPKNVDVVNRAGEPLRLRHVSVTTAAATGRHAVEVDRCHSGKPPLCEPNLTN
jgi:two-component system response regulator HydG